MFKSLQKIGKSLMLPIAVLPAAGLLLGIGGALSNIHTLEAYPMLNIPFLQGIFNIMASSGEIIFANLSLLICVGLSIGLAKEDKSTAGLAAVVAFLVMNAAIGSMINIFDPTIKSIDTGVFGSLVLGLVVSYLHNKYHNIQLPEVLGFFGGSRFIPIVASFSAIGVGVIFFLIWPSFQKLLVNFGSSLANLGHFGTFVYGFSLRLTGAIGLHHIIYPLFWLTELGGVEQVAGETVVGAQNIFFAQLANPQHTGLFTQGTRFFAGRFDTMMFGLPAASLAMYHTVPKEKRAAVQGLFLSGAITSFITGITEPIEFMFLFVSPLLYVIHAFYDGLSFYIADILNISIGNTFSGGLIDFILFGIIPGSDSTNWPYVLFVGVPWSILYYITFRLFITFFNIPTPGRIADDNDTSTSVSSNISNIAQEILAALGGKQNIEDIDACITRLRVNVINASKVNKEKIKALGATGIIEVQGGIQAIFGAKADPIKQAIVSLLEKKD